MPVQISVGGNGKWIAVLVGKQAFVEQGDDIEWETEIRFYRLKP